MSLRAHMLHPTLLALAVLLAGCPSAPRPDTAGPPAVPFAMTAPDARTVSIAGSFNRWDGEQHRLAGPDRSGRWTITLPLAPGRYEYLFVVNGTDWVPDPAAPSVSDGLGGTNSVVTVTAGQDRER